MKVESKKNYFCYKILVTNTNTTKKTYNHTHTHTQNTKHISFFIRCFLIGAFVSPKLLSHC